MTPPDPPALHGALAGARVWGVRPPVDVLVAGAGPGGTALAGALAARGLDVVLVDPAHGRPWRASYGAWADELAAGEGTGPGSVAAEVLALPSTRRWPGIAVADDAGARHLHSAYVRLDTAGLQAALDARAGAAGVRRLDGAVAAVEHGPAGTRALLRDGRTVDAALVVDATGHRGGLVDRAPGPAPAVQSAYGVVTPLAAPPVEGAGPVLMDFRTAHLPRDERAADPSFLYAFPLEDGRWFVEETSLARRPALPTAVLARRLALRLAARGEAPPAAHDVEHVRIPMDPPLPRAGQRVVAVGAAASAVHPATGYLLAATLRGLPALADAVVHGLGAGGGPDRAAELAWQVLWPPERVRVRRLHAFGLQALLAMDPPTTAAFFRAFFAAPTADWSAYLAGRQGTAATLAFMARLYAAAPPAVRRRLRGAALGPAGLVLAGAASGSLPPAAAGAGRAAVPGRTAGPGR